mmetsp:Transcript_33505/g.72433  ORF Transcript_33505/g.72433 Transcript_33505/m.72433 type:complete len:112 (+) Transcript_33505:3-338(+)
MKMLPKNNYAKSIFNRSSKTRTAKTTPTTTTVQRGYCNWLLPQTIMIGQYPGMTPELNGPSSKECRNHIEKMVQEAGITLFCCLQSEVPSQEDDIGWSNGDDGGGMIYLEP